jgi:glycolate oxidase iron-sulfur subunit
MDELYHDVNEATARVLRVNGCIVEIPSGQGCCGSLHQHSGFKEKAKELARKNIDALEDGSDAPIIVNAAGCGALLKEYGELLGNDPDYAERAKRLSARVKDVTEFLGEGEVVAGAPTGRRVTWDAPCHLYHAQRVQALPLRLFHAIPDLKLVPLPGFDRCCGSGGIYNLTHPDIAEEVLAGKLSAIRETGVDTVVTANPGCQMQIQAGLRAAGIPARVAHVVELLDESYAAAGLYE